MAMSNACGEKISASPFIDRKRNEENINPSHTELFRENCYRLQGP